MKKAFDQEKKARIERVRKFANIRKVMVDLDIPYNERSGGDLWFRCVIPIHREKDASAHIFADPTDPDHGFWKCFGCKESGDVIDLVRLVTQLSFWECVQWLEVRLGDEDVEQRAKPKPKPKLPNHFMNPSKVAEWKQPYIDYLFGREIQWWQIKKHRIGYVDQGSNRRRIIVPVMLGSKLCTWVGRAIGKNFRITSCPGGDVGLFGSEIAKVKNGPAIIVEGWADALRLERLGYLNVMALQTNQLLEQQYEFLRKFQYMIVMPDNDNGGKFLTNALAPFIERHEIYMANLQTEGADPDSAPESEVIYAMENLEEWKPVIVPPEIEIIL